jgi:predicted RNA polymerase sigma factor
MDEAVKGATPVHAGAAVMHEADAVRLTAEDVARRSYGKLVAYLAARTRDVAAAEDALSEAFAAALSDWPRTGCPDNPEGWLLTVARRKHIDALRRQRDSSAADDELERMAAVLDGPEDAGEIADRRLALMFACAHPAVDAGIRAPLMMQVILGFDAATIASAFLMSPAAMAKRLGRAKSKIREAGIPLCIPERAELAARLDTVLDAIYAAFAEGWSDAAGTDVERRELTGEALFLARLVTELLPGEPEALGLLALMLHAEARRRARRSADGAYIPLAGQDPQLWDAAMIAEAEAAASQRDAPLRTLPDRSGVAVGARGALPLRCRQLACGSGAVRHAGSHHRLAGSGYQSRAGGSGA